LSTLPKTADSEPPSRRPPTTSAPQRPAIVGRLLALAWRYRGLCLLLVGIQFVILAVSLAGLNLFGLGIDVIRHHVQPGTPAPRWPLGLHPPAAWSARDTILALALAMLALGLLRAGLTWSNRMVSAWLTAVRVVADLRCEIYAKLQALGFRYYDDHASGSLINRVTGDVQQVRAFLDTVLLQGIVLVVTLAVFLAWMLSLHVGLTLACLATTPVLVIATNWFSRRMRPEYHKTSQLRDRLILVLSESFKGIHVVKGFAREREEQAKFAEANAAVRDQQRGIFARVSVFSPAMGFLTQINLGIALAFGGWLVAHGRLDFGAGLVVFVELLRQFSGHVNNIANLANTAQQSLVAAQRVFEVLDAPVEVRSPPDAQRLPRARGTVEFDQVAFSYRPEEPVLRDLCFRVEPGQCVAILGATGAGKTSLLNLIPRFQDVTAGRVLIDGIDVRQLALEDLRRNVGIVFQESFLFSNSVAANIAFGKPDADRAEVEAAARTAQAHDFIAALPQGYDTVLGEFGLGLSGGQRQRLAIARAVLLQPPILLLDDPTAAIDPQTEHEILAALDRAAEGRTTFIVAHRLSTLRRADLILVIEDGRIVERGTHDQLLAVGGPYQRVARLQLVDDESRVLLDQYEARRATVDLPPGTVPAEARS